MKMIKFLKQYFGLFDIGLIIFCGASIIWGFRLSDENTLPMVLGGVIILLVWAIERVVKILKS